MPAKPTFDPTDPLSLDTQLTDDERTVARHRRAYCQKQLAPRVLEAFRHEKVDAAIFREMGALGMLGATIPEALRRRRARLRRATAWSRARSKASTRATAR